MFSHFIVSKTTCSRVVFGTRASHFLQMHAKKSIKNMHRCLPWIKRLWNAKQRSFSWNRRLVASFFPTRVQLAGVAEGQCRMWGGNVQPAPSFHEIKFRAIHFKACSWRGYQVVLVLLSKLPCRTVKKKINSRLVLDAECCSEKETGHLIFKF